MATPPVPPVSSPTLTAPSLLPVAPARGTFSQLRQLFSIAVEVDDTQVPERCIQAIIADPAKRGLCNRDELEKLRGIAQRTLLMGAAQAGSAELVQALVQDRVGIHAADGEGNTALHFAAQNGHLESVIQLAQHLGINRPNVRGETPVHLAIKAGHHKVVEWFMQRRDWNTKLLEEGFELPPIALAVKYGQRSCLEVLLTEESIQSQTTNLGNLLHVAVRFGQPLMLEYLLHAKKVADCLKAIPLRDFLEARNPKGQSALSLAAERGEDLALHLLFCRGASLETQDLRQMRPLHYAALGRHFDTVQLLIRLGAQTEVIDGEHRSPKSLVANDTEGDGKSIYNYLDNELWKELDPDTIFHPEPAENFVFKGGGPKGVAYAGALKAAEADGILQGAKRFGGTSSGAITSTFLGVGFTAFEIEEVLMKTEIVDFLDAPQGSESFMELVNDKGSAISKAWHFLRTIRSTAQILLNPIGTIEAVFNLTGICAGEKFLDWAEEHIREKTGIKWCTFGELRRAIENGDKRFRHLTIYATLLNSQGGRSIFKFSTEDLSCDDMIISHALRCSMSIPGVFKPHTIHIKKGGKIHNLAGLGTFVDGGMLYNLPIETYDFRRYQDGRSLDKDGMFPVFNTRTVGFNLYSALEPTDDVKAPDGLIPLLKALMGVYMSAESSIRNLSPFAAYRIVNIDIGNIGLLDFKLTDEQKRTLIRSGYQATHDYFDRPLLSQRFPQTALLKAHKGFLGLPPAPPKREFAGRHHFLTQLHYYVFFSQLGARMFPEQWSGIETPPAILYGEGADELAIAFGYKFLDQFSLVKCIDCTSKESAVRCYQELAGMLKIRCEPDKLVHGVNTALEKRTFTENEVAKPWLLLFTHCTQNLFKELKLFFPERGGAVLLASTECNFRPNKEVVFDVKDFQKKEAPDHAKLLLTAAEKGRLGTALHWIDQGVDIEAVDDQTRSPLLLSVTHGHLPLMRLLLSKNANPFKRYHEGETLVHMMTQFGHLEMLRELLLIPECRALVNARDSSPDCLVPLHKVVKCSKDFKPAEMDAIVDLLLLNGADPNALSKHYYAPLHWAAKHGHVRRAQLLIDAGAHFGFNFDTGRIGPLNGNDHGQQNPLEMVDPADAPMLAYLNSKLQAPSNLLDDALRRITLYLSRNPSDYKKRFYTQLQVEIAHVGISIQSLEFALSTANRKELFDTPIGTSAAAQCMADLFQLLNPAHQALNEEQWEKMVKEGLLH